MAKQKRAFSKTLLIQESVLLWIMTLVFLYLAYLAITKDYTGSLPWLAAMVSFPWAAYSVSAGFYYNKAKAENTQGGITYDSAFSKTVNTVSDILTVDRIDGSSNRTTTTTSTTSASDNECNTYKDSIQAEDVTINQSTEAEFDSGNKMESFPELQNKTVDYTYLNPDPEGPI